MFNQSKQQKTWGGRCNSPLNTRLFKRLRLMSIPLLFTFILTVSSVYADNNNTYSSDKTYNVKGVVNYNRGTVDNSEQYELKINKGVSVNDVHVELLPDNNGKYWIPKGYKVKVSADCDEGYEQSGGSDIYTIDDTQTVSLNSTPAPPSKLDELEQEIIELKQEINKVSENSVGGTDVLWTNYTVTSSIQPFNSQTIHIPEHNLSDYKAINVGFSRLSFDTDIDWNCTIYNLPYSESNFNPRTSTATGIYTSGGIWAALIQRSVKVDFENNDVFFYNCNEIYELNSNGGTNTNNDAMYPRYIIGIK